jgi:chaperone modulatory protein CbpM
LTHDFGVIDEGIDLVLHLMDQLHGMRHALTLLQSEIRR